MKALVTGASGFVGSHLAELLSSKGFDVRCNVRKSSNLRWLDGKGFELVDAPLSDIEKLKKAVEGVDYIYHSAGLVAAKNYEEFLKGNRDGTVNLLNAAYQVNPNLKRFVYVSSLAAAGPSESLEKPKTEDMPCEPITAYGKSKKAAEVEVHKFQGRLPFTIARPSAVYGPRDPATFDIFRIVKMGVKALMGFGKKYANIVHVGDLVRGIAESGLADNTIGKTYFVGSEESYTWEFMMGEMAKGFGKKAVNVHIPHTIIYTAAALSEFFGKFSKKPPVFNFEKGVDFVQKYWTCSIQNAMKDFGYKPQINIKDGFKETIDWYRENNWF